MKGKSGGRDRKVQSAMEYLMTYGWAILIIAVVLGSLYSLGVFNTANLQPKVAGGGCHIYRPNGPGTTWNINLVGSCQNALPQYVAQFNGQSGYVTVGASQSLDSNTFTIAAWVYPKGAQDASAGIVCQTAAQGPCLYDGYSGGQNNFHLNSKDSCGIGNTITSFPNRNWYFVSVTYDRPSQNLAFYVNGALIASSTTGCQPQFLYGALYIGTYGYPTPHIFNGSIADVQLYNATLSQQAITALYREGIGGVPMSLQSLVAWWPLNGDFKDYSGNNNNGAPTAVNFNGSWTSGYYH